MKTSSAGGRFLAAVALSLFPATCWAQGTLVPNGSPTGAANAFPTGTNVGIEADPAKAISPQDSTDLLLALKAQGYNPANISYSSTAGTYSNDSYFAFANKTPGAHGFGFNVHGFNFPGGGGVSINIDYNPVGPDPTGSAVHWISVITTNDPTPFGKRHGVDLGGGFYSYIDDAHNSRGNPYYDQHGTANSQGFIDDPARHAKVGLVWEAETYTVTGTLTGNPATAKLDIESGVSWGYMDVEAASVPEPSTLVLLGTGGLFGLGVWWHRRRVAARRPLRERTPGDSR